MSRQKRSTKPHRNTDRAADKTLYCARCGISFLWTTEEQKLVAAQQMSDTQTGPPTLCPGCRQLITPPERERGLVRWYNRRKNYGFILRQTGADIFAHASEVQVVKNLHTGDLVEYGVEETERGPAAVGIRLLERHAQEPE